MEKVDVWGVIGMVRRSLSSRYDELEAARVEIEWMEKLPGYLKCLMEVMGKLMGLLVSGEAVAETGGLLLATAIIFKNYIRKRWNNQQQPSEGGLDLNMKEEIKGELISLLLVKELPRNAHSQLAESLAIIAEFEFPTEWPTLLPTLVNSLKIATQQQCNQPPPQQQLLSSNGGGTTDNDSSNKSAVADALSTLEVIHIILKKYRIAMRNNEILRELQIILAELEKPLLSSFLTFKQTFDQISSNHSEQSVLLSVYLLKILLQFTKIFYSLNVVDLPEFFELHMHEFFTAFTQLLYWRPNFLPNQLNQLFYTKSTNTVQKLQYQICDCLKIYSDKYQEEFFPLVPQSTKAVWDLLMELDDSTSNDFVVCAALKFMASVSQTKWEAVSQQPNGAATGRKDGSIFADLDVLRQICTRVIIPNIHLRDSDLMNMEENPQEFLRKDLEGTGESLRRSAALELVKSLTILYEEQIQGILLQCVSEISQQFANTSNTVETERLKDSCAYLMIALGARTASRVKGVIGHNENVDIFKFYDAYLATELASKDLNERIISKYATLKFLTTYRNQFPQQMLCNSLPLIIYHLSAKNPLIHSIAAHCIERILSVRSPNGKFLINPKDVKSNLLTALSSLLKLIASDSAISDNEFLMKCLLRIFIFLDAEAMDICVPFVEQLLEIVKVKSANPINPIFNHFLFETVAVIIKVSSPLHITKLESMLIPIISTILQQGVHDFTPYSLQLLSLLLSSKAAAAPTYAVLYTNLLSDAIWTASQANVPAIVVLLTAYFKKYDVFASVIQENIRALLERLQYCLYNRKLMATAFDLLNAMFKYLPFSFYSQYFKNIITLLFVKIQAQREGEFVRESVVSLALFLHSSDSPAALLNAMEDIQPGLMENFMEHIFIPNARKVTNMQRKKVLVLGSAKLAISAEMAPKVHLLHSILLLLSDLLAGKTGLVEFGGFKGKVAAMMTSEENQQQTTASANSAMATEIALEKATFDVVYTKLSTIQSAPDMLIEASLDVNGVLRTLLSSSGSVKGMVQQSVDLMDIAQFTV